MEKGAALQVEPGGQGWRGGRQPDWVINNSLPGQGNSMEYLHISLRFQSYSWVGVGGNN